MRGRVKKYTNVSLVRSLVRAYVPSFVRSFVRSCMHSFIHSFIHSLFLCYFRANQWVGLYQFNKQVIENYDVRTRRRGWRWLDGSDFTWYVWRGSEPSKKERCARLHKDKELVGTDCGKKHYFICKQVSIMPCEALYLCIRFRIIAQVGGHGGVVI